MPHRTQVQRPSFPQALEAWKALLGQQGLPEQLLWVFDENLCFERDVSRPGGFRLGIQTAFSPPPPDAEQLAYEYFCDFAAPVVFYRAGNCRGKSVCLLLCDDWFRGRKDADGYIRREDWLILFRPGPAEEIEEISERQRWTERIIRNRPLHDLDFCMTLRGVHEILAHGRVLTTYEHYALRFFHLWHRMLGERH